jgi:hypothetical protein
LANYVAQVCFVSVMNTHLLIDFSLSLALYLSLNSCTTFYIQIVKAVKEAAQNGGVSTHNTNSRGFVFFGLQISLPTSIFEFCAFFVDSQLASFYLLTLNESF